jgi:hypothetical protein
MDWINLVQDRDQWKVLVNTVMNLRFYKVLGYSSAAGRLAASQEVLGFMESVYFGFICQLFYFLFLLLLKLTWCHSFILLLQRLQETNS